MQTDNQIIFEGNFPVNIIQEDNYFIASSPVLDDLDSYGQTLEEAHRNFGEMLMGTFIILHEEGKLKEFLTSCGWQVNDEGEQIHVIPPFIIKTINNYKPENISV